VFHRHLLVPRNNLRDRRLAIVSAIEHTGVSSANGDQPAARLFSQNKKKG
jgi:hypothetical protein